MIGLRMRALQDLSHILPVKSLQHDTRASTMTFKRHVGSLLSFSRKKEKTCETRKANLSTVLNNSIMESTFIAPITLSEIATISLNCRLPMYLLHSEANTKMKRLKALEPLVKHNDLSSLNGNLESANKYDAMHPSVQANDLGFACNNNLATHKADCESLDCNSKLVSSLQDNRDITTDCTTEQMQTDNLSAHIAAKNNVKSLPSTKPELTTARMKQKQSQNDQYSRKLDDDSSQSSQLHSRDVKHQNFRFTQPNLSSVMEQHIQRQSQVARHSSLQTPAIVCKPSPPSLVTFQQSSATSTQEYPESVAESSAPLFAESEVPRNVASEWSSMEQPYSARKYRTRKISDAEADVVEGETRQKDAYVVSSQLHQSACSGNIARQGSQNPASCLVTGPRRFFSSKSFTGLIQRSPRTIGSSREDSNNANVSIIRLKSTRSHGIAAITGRVSLAKWFSCDASKSKKSSDCDEQLRCKTKPTKCGTCSQEPERVDRASEDEETCRKTRSRRRDTCEQNEFESRELCRRSEQRKKDCCDREQYRDGEETRGKSDVNGRARKEDRRSREPTYSRDNDTKCQRKRRSNEARARKRTRGCEKSDKSRTICTDPCRKENNNCSESKYEEQCENREKDRNCRTRSNRRISKNNRRRNSFQIDNKNCCKTSGTRRYSQQSIFSVSRDYGSSSILIPDIVHRVNNAKQTTQKFYASSSKDQSSKSIPSCEKSKKECEIEECDSKKKCIKGPANCLTRRSVADQAQACQKDERLSEPTRKSCIEEYCASKKEPAAKDKKCGPESIKQQQIEREYKEIEECKKGFKGSEKKDNKITKASSDCKPTTSLERVVSPCKQEREKDKFASTPTERTSYWSFTVVTRRSPFSILQSGVINGAAAMYSKDVTLFNVMFDRSFSTVKVNCQDDPAVSRIADNGKTVENCRAGNNESLHDGDELPLHIEIENEEEDEVNNDNDTESLSRESIAKTV